MSDKTPKSAIGEVIETIKDAIVSSVEKSPKRPWTDKDKEELIRLSRKGFTLEEIAEQTGRTSKSVEKKIREIREEQMGALSGGTFIIGLALMLFGVIPWWPGIMFVFAATALTDGLVKNKLRDGLIAAMWLGGIGLVFTVGFSLPLILIMIGVTMILGFMFKGAIPMPRSSRAEEDQSTQKRKNEWRERERLAEPEEDESYEKPKRGAMRLGPDGELIEITDDEARRSAQRR